jgi:hypothetical protein
MVDMTYPPWEAKNIWDPASRPQTLFDLLGTGHFSERMPRITKGRDQRVLNDL